MMRSLARTAAALLLAGAPSGSVGAQELPGTLSELSMLRAAVGTDTGTPADSLRLARLELSVGHPERALALTPPPGSVGADSVAVLEVSAEGAEALAWHGEAARAFARAARASRGERAGILHARAARAFEENGERDRAAEEYAQAARLLPDIAGWIGVRQARLTPVAWRAFALLQRAPKEAWPLVEDVRIAVLMRQHDTVGALHAMVRGGRLAEAAALAVARGDFDTARTLGRRAVVRASVREVERILDVLGDSLLVGRPSHGVGLAAAWSRLGRYDEAVRALERTLAALPPTARAHRLLGDAYARAGQSDAARRAYEQAKALGGADGATAAYRLLEIGGRSGSAASRAALQRRFVDEYPWAPEAPEVLGQLAEWYRVSGRREDAAAAARRLDRDWPTSSAATGARMRQAEAAARAGSLAETREWYRAEIAAGGAERYAARYLLAALEAADGRPQTARELWEELAADDPWGYHGAMARRALGVALPPSVPSREIPAPRVRAAFRQLDALVACGLDGEARLLRQALAGEPAFSLDERLALAAGLIERGHVSEGVSLGWRVAATTSLDDVRVLRTIFPWPYRQLIEQEAAEHGVDPYLIAAMIRQESTFRPEVTSRAGARGLMQLMPATAAWLAGRDGMEWDERLLALPDANLHLGTAHFATLLSTYDGNEAVALAAYNAGGTPTRRWRRLARGDDVFAFVRTIGYAETRGYVQSVLRNRDLYRALYPSASRLP